MKRLTIIAIALLGFLPGGTAWASSDEDLAGREVARIGTRLVLEGTLRYIDGEWWLQSADAMYELHMGAWGGKATEAFEDGVHAEVAGFVHGGDVTPIVIQTASQQLRFWSEERLPLWAGRGQRLNEVTADEGYGHRDTRPEEAAGGNVR